MSGLRAADADRNVIEQLLGEAFAEGRLDRQEYDERLDATLAARTLGELPPMLADLLPERPLLPRATHGSTYGRGDPAQAELRARGEEHFLAERRSALLGFLGPTLICWVIWWLTMFGEFPWPAIVMAATFVNLLRVQLNREQIVGSQMRRIQRKRDKQLRKSAPKDPEAG